MTEQRFRHFADPAVVEALVAEIKGRHGESYAALIARIVPQIRGYWERSFTNPSAPTRFAGVGSGLVRERLIVALSGGIDSTVVTYLAVRAVGRDAVLPVTMPAR